MKAYICYFNQAHRVASDILTPIQVGRTLSNVRLAMIGDDTGDNISELNPFFNELTAQYWVWKNVTDEGYVGFFHYRRYMDFSGATDRIEDAHGLLQVPSFDGNFLKDYGLDDETLREFTQRYDIILPKPYSVCSLHPTTVRGQYEDAPAHNSRDYDIAETAVAELYPSDLVHFEAVSNGSEFYPTNMFLMKWGIFEQYCAWMFPLLFRIYRRIDVTDYSAAEKRAVGYLAERLFSVFVRKYMQENPSVSYVELPRVLVANTAPVIQVRHATAPSTNCVTVVASTDVNYVPQISALIASILRTTDIIRPLEFVVLEDGLTETHRSSLRSLVDSRTNTDLHFIDMSGTYKNVKMHSYFPKSTLFRLDLPAILPNHNKVLFLDTDMVARHDVAELFDIDIGDALIGAVPDLIMRSFSAMGNTSSSETGSRKTATYLADHLKLGRSTNDYFQAGTLIFNLAAMRESQLSDRMIGDAQSLSFWFFDQDILNKHCHGRVHFLDFKWNAVFMDDFHKGFLSKADRDAFIKSLESPAIIHFAGIGKPWLNDNHPWSHMYWKYLRDTDWYETSLIKRINKYPADNPSKGAAAPPSQQGGLTGISSALWHTLPQSIRYGRLKLIGSSIKRALQAQ